MQWNRWNRSKMAEKAALAAVVLTEIEESQKKRVRNSVEVALMATVILSSLEGDARVRMQSYVEDIVPLYADEDFRGLFRVKTSTFKLLVEHLETFTELHPLGPGRREPITLEKKLLITLWYLGGNDTFRRIADRFGVSESTAVECRDKVIAVIMKLKEKLIKWPKLQELQQQAQLFVRRNGFPGIVGAIDGTHIEIKAPQENAERYINRHKRHSIQVQCVCKHDRQFIHVFVGYPGSVHDARVLKNSDLWEDGLSKCHGAYHILGDAAYPLRKWLLTPYRDNGNLNPQQKKYNFYHSSNRMVIERAFGLLKCRFRRLHYLDTATVPTAVNIIMACCILHNLCIQQDDIIDDVFEDDNNNGDQSTRNATYQDQTNAGIIKRNNITQNLV